MTLISACAILFVACVSSQSNGLMQDQYADYFATFKHRANNGSIANHDEGSPNESEIQSSGEIITFQDEEINREDCGEGFRKIVRCKDSVDEQICRDSLVQAGYAVVAEIPGTAYFAICIASEAEADKVLGIEEVLDMEDDVIRRPSIVPGSVKKRKLQSAEDYIPYGLAAVKAPEFWSTYNTRGAGVKICVIDSGLIATHEDIQGATIAGSNNYTDLVTPWSEDGDFHGTHVTGIIAAQINSKGLIGVAPDSLFHIVRVFRDDGMFSGSNLIEALTACDDNGADIISMSLGGPQPLQAEMDTIGMLKAKGILLIAAAGNDALAFNSVSFPAAYSDVMSVAAIDVDINIAPFSTHNNEVDISAPGVDVLSTYGPSDDAYAYLSGTSMATPFVSGLAALLWSQFPDRSENDIRAALEQTARDVGACGIDRMFGHGMVDVMAAASYLENGISETTEEQTGCVMVDISITTDDWGLETTYIVLAPSAGGVVYRGGPYPNYIRGTYTDNIMLPPGCYNIILLDAYGDGNSNADLGVGGVEVTYDGEQQISYFSFEGSVISLEFGDCDGGEITSAPTKEPTADPTASPTERQTSGPTAGPTSSPTAGPIAIPTAGPTKGPTLVPTLGPTSGPASGPTSGPISSPTSSPTSDPTIGPSPTPTPGPTQVPTPRATSGPTSTPTFGVSVLPTVGPTTSASSEPSESVSIAPTWTLSQSPSNGSTTLPEPRCQEDIGLVHPKDSEDPYPDVPIAIVAQTNDMVTFRVQNTYGSTLPYVYTSFREADHGRHCYETKDLPPQEYSEEYTAQCMHISGFALVELWVVGPSGYDTGEQVPDCCHPPSDLGPEIIRYTFKLYCKSQCLRNGDSDVLLT